VVVEGVALQRQMDEVALAGIVGGGDVEDDGNQELNVLDTDSLGVEVGDGGGLEHCLRRRGGRCRCFNISRTRHRGGAATPTRAAR
jgi:hypothetical protein